MLFLRSFVKSNPKKILFIHGFLGSGCDFFPLMRLLNARFDCLAVDLPGHGRSCFNPVLSKHALLEDLVMISKEHKVDYLIGYSLGGRLALEMDYRFPCLFKKIVLLSSHPGIENKEKQHREKKIAFWQSLIDTSPETFLNAWYSQALFQTLSKKKIMQKRKGFDTNAAKWALDELSLLKQPLLSDHIKKHSNKFLCICGAKDLYYRQLYSTLNCKKIIPDASHAIHVEKPNICYKHILKHLLSSKEL